MCRTLLLLFIGLPFWVQAQVPTVNRSGEITQLVDQVNVSNLRDYMENLVGFGTRHTLSEDQPNRGIEASRQYALGLFQQFAAASNGRLTAEIDYYTERTDGRRVDQDTRTGNVMATLKGTDPSDNRVFLVSAHIDTRVSDVMDRVSDSPGANDDGSGVVAVLEMARILSKKPFPATIVFALVSGEEQGLLGADYLAKKAKQEKWNLVAMLNNDMIGNSTSNGTQLRDNTRLRVFSEGIPMVENEQMEAIRKATNGENDSKSRQLARYIKDVGERYVDQLEIKLIYRNDRFMRGGDHTPFARQGFTAIRLCEFNENYYQQHQDLRTENGAEYGDVAEHIDYEYLRKNTAVNVAVLANLASAPSVPQDVSLDLSPRAVSIENINHTLLKWNEPEHGSATGYYVLMRETSSPMWEKKFYTSEREIKLPYSKDNYFFAVQAVTDGGFESLAVFPQPIR
ncbi:MAG: M28 family metallopeptidase [Lunatimonas sp.]|uniref:M28 family metallopeptidase n=1 Tax=Lunatimonas sp. TaxID=2060141 RepID=UPI00263B4703|nr:M28 family metallopeptidase [Lunatimonas sp.]MCC5935857.1 M28 family metallopeptidase [Lunatimonas sp.]